MTKPPKPGPIQKAIERLPVGYYLRLERAQGIDDDGQDEQFMFVAIYREDQSQVHDEELLAFCWDEGDRGWKAKFTNWLNGWADENG